MCHQWRSGQLVAFLGITICLSGSLSAADVNQPPGHCCPIDKSRLWRKDFPAGLKSPATASLEKLYDYNFVIPRRYLGQSISYYGPANRLRRFVSDLLSGSRPLKVGIVGGSVARGVAAPGDLGFFYTFCNEYLSSVTRQTVSCRNGAIPGTPSAYMVMCLKYSVDPDVDLVFVEYNMNDGMLDTIAHNRIRLTMERLLRRLLDLPSKPAVVVIQAPMATPTDLRPYYVSGEYLQAVNEIYYAVPTVSPHTSLFHALYTYQEPGFAWNQTFQADHPGALGHRAMADLLVHLVQETAVDLVHRPLAPGEARGAEPPLPDPMTPGNTPPSSSSCMVGEDFTQLVVAASGWAWVDEGQPGKPKWGYVSNTTGSSLVFEVDSVRPHLPANASVAMVLYYLASYSPMGVARVECVSGCRCNATEVDAHIQEHWSQTYPATFAASQSPACHIRVTLTNKTTSGGHKFKVVGSVVTDQDASANALDPYMLNMGVMYQDPTFGTR